jgi:hypothetical protein
MKVSLYPLHRGIQVERVDRNALRDAWERFLARLGMTKIKDVS